MFSRKTGRKKCFESYGKVCAEIGKLNGFRNTTTIIMPYQNEITREENVTAKEFNQPFAKSVER